MAIVLAINTEFDNAGLKAADTEVKKSTSTFEKIGTTVSKAAVPAAAALSAIGGAAVKMGKEALGAKQANDVLSKSLANAGFPGAAADAIAYADSLSKTIGVEDEQIKATMSMLTAFDSVASSSDMMARVVTAGADMAAKGFGTMESSSKLLGKALEDPTKGINALFRAGVAFTDQQKEQIKAMQEAGDMAGAQAIIMGEVEKTFGGAAAASRTAGDSVKIAMGEAAEALGATLLPAIETVAGWIVKLSGWIQQNASTVKVLATVVAGLSAALVAANIAFKAVAVGMKVATVAVKAFGLALKLAKGPIAWIATAVVALVVVIVKNWDQIKAATQKVWNWISNFLTGIWNGLKSGVSKAWNAITNIVKKAWNLIKNIITHTNPFLYVLTHLEKVKGWVKAAWDWIKTKVQTVWNGLKNIFTTNPFDKIQTKLNEVKGWFTNIFGGIETWLQGWWTRISGVFDKAKAAAKKAGDAVRGALPGGRTATTGVQLTALPVVSSLAAGVPHTRLAPVQSATATSGGVTININGALDPEAVGRQVRRLLDDHDRRQGRTVVRAVAF